MTSEIALAVSVGDRHDRIGFIGARPGCFGSVCTRGFRRGCPALGPESRRRRGTKRRRRYGTPPATPPQGSSCCPAPRSSRSWNWGCGPPSRRCPFRFPPFRPASRWCGTRREWPLGPLHPGGEQTPGVAGAEPPRRPRHQTETKYRPESEPVPVDVRRVERAGAGPRTRNRRRDCLREDATSGSPPSGKRGTLPPRPVRGMRRRRTAL